MGVDSVAAVTHLFGSSRVVVNGKTQILYGIVSKFTTHLLVSLGDKFWDRIVEVAQSWGNPSFTGWVVELEFIRLCKSGELTLKFDDSGCTDSMNFDERTGGTLKDFPLKVPELLQQERVLLWVPTMWNQPAYDLLVLENVGEHGDEGNTCSSIELTFYQVTTAIKHELLQWHLQAVIDRINNLEGFAVSDTKVIFVRPEGFNQASIDNVSARGIRANSVTVKHASYESKFKKSSVWFA